jgi:hypothetical protein
LVDAYAAAQAAQERIGRGSLILSVKKMPISCSDRFGILLERESESKRSPNNREQKSQFWS